MATYWARCLQTCSRSSIALRHQQCLNSALISSSSSLAVPRRTLATDGGAATLARIGFIGLGNMGAHMARNLIASGHPVTCFDVNPDSVKALTDSGAQSASCPAEVAAAADTVVTMLPASPHVRGVYCGADGIFSTVQPGTMLIDSSTIDPSTSLEMSQLAAKKSAVYMDAPVSGGVMKAKSGELSFMVGATEEEFAAAKGILTRMGTNVIHCGPVSTGQAAKICNNMLLAICMIGTSETMNLGMNLGLDPKTLAHVINTSSGSNWACSIYNPVPGVKDGTPACNDYKGGFGTALMTKDLGLVQNAATATASPNPLGSLAHQIYRVLTNSGYAEKDFSSVYKFLSEQKHK